MVIRNLSIKIAGLILVLLMGSINGMAQDPPPSFDDYNYGEWRRAMADWNMKHFSNGGILLVRLQSNTASIKALNDSGQHKRAKKFEDKLENENHQKILAFKKAFTFCDVYFFSSNYSEAVRNHELSTIPWIDKVIQGNEKENLDSTFFLTAEFTTLEPDTMRWSNVLVPGVRLEEDSKDYYGSSNLGIPVLVIKSDQFVQLQDPFPYYVRTYKSLPAIKRKPMKTVLKMDEYLRRYRLRIEKRD